MLIINEYKIMQLRMHGCNVVIIAYRLCQLCASYSAMINFAMLNFCERITCRRESFDIAHTLSHAYLAILIIHKNSSGHSRPALFKD